MSRRKVQIPLVGFVVDSTEVEFEIRFAVDLL